MTDTGAPSSGAPAGPALPSSSTPLPIKSVGTVSMHIDEGATARTKLFGDVGDGAAATAAPAAGEVSKLLADPQFMQRYMHDSPNVRARAIAEMSSAQAKDDGERQRVEHVVSTDALRGMAASADPVVAKLAGEQLAARERGQAQPGRQPTGEVGEQASGDADAASDGESLEPRSSYDIGSYDGLDAGVAVGFIDIAREAAIPSGIFNQASELIRGMGDGEPDAAAIHRNYADVKASMDPEQWKLGAAALRDLVLAHPGYDAAIDRLMSRPETARWLFKTAALEVQRRQGR